jgi:hypothetical protein
MSSVAVILRDFPYFDEETQVIVQGQVVPVRSSQIIVWASVSEISLSKPPSAIPPIPVVIDTGLSHNFSIQAEQLIDWVGIDPTRLPLLGAVSLVGKRIAEGEALPVLQRRSAAVWLHRNQPGQRDVLRKDRPFRLELEGGIIVYPQRMIGAPRLPALGLRGLQWSKLHLSINAAERRVMLRAGGKRRTSLPGK